MTIPQQYFLSKEDAEEAAINNKRNRVGASVIDKSSRHPQPTGVKPPRAGLPRRLGTEQMAIEDKKADSITEVLDRLAEDTDGSLPVGLHNLRIHLNLPPSMLLKPTAIG